MINREKSALSGVAQVVLLVILVGLGLSGCSEEPTELEYVERAKEHQDKGDLGAAVIELKNALRKNLNNPEARWLLGQIYVELGAGSEAEKELRHAVEYGVSPEVAAIPLARAYLQQGKFEDVMAGIAPPLLNGTGQNTLWALQGHAQLGLRNFDEAGELYDAALSNNPDEQEALFGKARLAATRGELDEAKASLEKLLATHPDYAAAWSLLGDIERFREHAESADEAYGHAIEHRPNNTEDLIRRAQVRIYLENYNAAADDLDRLKKSGIRHPGIQYTQGLLHYQQKQYADAQTAFREILGTHPGHMPAIYYMGLVSYMQGQLEQAERHLRRFVNARPGFSLAAKQLAAVRLETGDNAGAEEVLKAVLARDPNDEGALDLMGSASLALNKGESGVTYYKKLAELRPESAAAMMKVGLGLLMEGKSDEAIQELENVIELDPEQQDADLVVIETHLRAREFDLALAAAKRLVDRQPGSSRAWNAMGVAYAGSGDLTQAQQAFERALELEPGFPASALNLAKLALRAGEFDRARSLYEAAREKNPTDLRTLLALAELEARQENTDKSLTLLHTAVREHPRALQPRLLLANFYLGTGQADKALAVTSEVAAMYVDNPSFLVRFGAAQMETGRSLEAVQTFKTLVAASPESADAHYALANAYAKTGKLEESRPELDRALSLDPGHLEARLLETELLIREEKLEEAGKRLDALEQEGSENPDLSRLKGTLAWRETRYAAAETAFAAELASRPSTRAVIDLSKARWRAGNQSDAITTLEDWLKDHPEDQAALLALASTYTLNAQLEDAEKTFETLLQVAPDHVLALNNLASLIETKDPKRALDYANRAYTLAPDAPAVMDTLAMLLLKQGDEAKGVRLLRDAVEAAPGVPLFRYHLAVSLAQTGAKSEARTIVKDLLQSPHLPQRDRAEALLKELGEP